MQEFLSRLGRTAATAASRAGNKAGEVIEVGKLKSRISGRRQDIENTKKEIGEYCYELFRSGRLENTAVKELCEKISDCLSEIDELEDQIRDTKDEYKAKNEDNVF